MCACTVGSEQHFLLLEAYVAAFGQPATSRPFCRGCQRGWESMLLPARKPEKQAWEALTHKTGNSQMQEECLEVLATKKNGKSLFSNCATLPLHHNISGCWRKIKILGPAPKSYELESWAHLQPTFFHRLLGWLWWTIEWECLHSLYFLMHFK